MTAPVEQAQALIDLTYGHGSDFQVEVHSGVLTLHVPDRSKFDFGWAAAKPRVIDQLRTHLKPTSIKVVEEYVTPSPKEAAKETHKTGAKDEPAAKEAEESSDPEAKGASSHSHAKAAKPKSE